MISQVVAQWLAVGAGVVAVPVTSLFKNKGWDKKAKFALASFVSILASLGIVIPAAVTDAGVNSGAVIATSIAASQILYKLVAEGTKFEDKLASSLVKPKTSVTREAEEVYIPSTRVDEQVIDTNKHDSL
jgi:hypothetical protein